MCGGMNSEMVYSSICTFQIVIIIQMYCAVISAYLCILGRRVGPMAQGQSKEMVSSHFSHTGKYVWFFAHTICHY